MRLMVNTLILPDQVQINKIRKYLWCGREFGQAAVMIGAGFSINAERISTSTPLFPLWDELAKCMYEFLYQTSHLSRVKNNVGADKGSVLKLASEYEATFGRQALDDLLLKLIPDMHYMPGYLHRLLLSLPWSDVFTTNYDTLLERTLPTIHDRKYDLILMAPDIPGRMKPRIVKLHGSFPSIRPFIITEEDYRNYPTQFAPFVNMVQQSIMENAFCLIGFSGDDPNFFYWSGWVRDNLGSNTLPIYLCGLLNLSPSRRRVLERRNIIPIDLSPIFPESSWLDSEIRYAKALEWFLLNLMYGAPPNIMFWPIPSSGNVWRPSNGLPPIPPGPPTLSDPGSPYPEPSNLLTDPLLLETGELRKLYETWRLKRLEYPGWVFAPIENREIFWAYTEQWIEPVLHSVDKLPPPENLLMLYELNWRLETSQMPLFADWVEKISRIIELFNPYPNLVEVKNAHIEPDKEEYKQMDWVRIGRCWIALNFALARNAREDQDENYFRFLMDRLEKITKQNQVWQAQWFYEESLFHLFRFDQKKIRKTLGNWQVTHDLPFWKVRYGSILAELGDLDEAEKLAEEALTEIRHRLQSYSTDYFLLSQEGWTMILLRSIKLNKFSIKIDLEGQYKDRWEKLGTYRCNPWSEIEMLVSRVSGSPPSFRPQKEIKKQFDPGMITVTHRFSSSLNISDFYPAFAFLRMFEIGAVPMKCDMVNMFSKAVVNSAKWIEQFSPLWSLSSMIRSYEDEEIKEWFNRVRIATLTQAEVDHLNHLFLNSLTQGIQLLANNSQQVSSPEKRFSRRQVTLISELISRLCLRFSIEQLDKLFKITIDMYKAPILRQFYFAHSSMDDLFKRILYTMPQSEILHRIPELLSLPIPTEMGFEVCELQNWAEPFHHIEWLENTKLSNDFDRLDWAIPIENLLRVVKQGTPEARKRSSLRLEKLYEIDGLNSEESRAFGEALWSRIDPNKGLPSDTSFFAFAFLSLPEPHTGVAKENFKRFLFSSDFPRVVQYSTTPDGKQTRSMSIGSQDYNSYIREWLSGTIPLFTNKEEDKKTFVDWTTEEAITLLKKSIVLWNDEKEGLKERDIEGLYDIGDTLKKQFLDLMKLMAGIVLPRLASVDEETKILAKTLLYEMEQSGLCVLTALPMTLYIDPNSYNEVAKKLRDGLNSMEETKAENSIIGLFYWLVHSARQKIPIPPLDLGNELINRVVARRQPALNVAIRYLAVLVWRLPQLFNESQMDSVSIALEYLIKETELPSRRDQETSNNFSSMIPTKDLPEYRALSASLAYWLFVQYKNTEKEIPQILLKWQEICKNDPLPEVKRAWR